MKQKQSKPAAYFDKPNMNVNTVASNVNTIKSDIENLNTASSPVFELLISGDINGENEVLNFTEAKNSECVMFKLKFLDDYWDNSIYSDRIYYYYRQARTNDRVFYSTDGANIFITFDYDHECYRIERVEQSGQGVYVLPGYYVKGKYVAIDSAYARLTEDSFIVYVPGLGICSVYSWDSDSRQVYLAGMTCDSNHNISIVTFNPFGLVAGQEIDCAVVTFKFDYTQGIVELNPSQINEKLASLEERIAALEK